MTAIDIVPSDADLIAAYEHLGSVWKVGAIFNLAGQSVHRKLRKLHVNTSNPPEFTEQQKQKIKDFYQNTAAEKFDLATLAVEIGKSKANIARFARRLGLTDMRRPNTQATRKKLAGIPKWLDKPHPRGMLGKKHKPEAKAKVSEAHKRLWATYKAFNIGLMAPDARAALSARVRLAIAKRPASKMYSRAKGGTRPDLGDVHFRSSWEANYARYLNLLKKLGVVEYWEFEPETFWFDGIRRGVTCYRPDFRIKYKGDDKLEYVEIKGWVQSKDKTKWKRMKKYHPHIKLIIVGAKEYYALARKWSSAISEWERPAP